MTPDADRKRRSVAALLDRTTRTLREAGVEDARLNAELLLADALGCSRSALHAHPERRVPEQAGRRFAGLVRRRAAREPLQHLLGRWEFYGREFLVTPDVMVPRQETGLLVSACLDLLEPGAQAWAADIGTGSGVIGVTLAAERPALHVVCTDSSAAALQVARRNAERHGVAERVLFAQGDLTRPVHGCLPAGREGVELVVSNPPYVRSGRIGTLAPEVRDHDPRAALDGGPDGLDVIRRIIPEAVDLLLPGGHLALELGEDQADRVAELLGSDGRFAMETLATRRDAAGCARVLSVQKLRE
jgi:release factor glutamine methyltransferase